MLKYEGQIWEFRHHLPGVGGDLDSAMQGLGSFLYDLFLTVLVFPPITQGIWTIWPLKAFFSLYLYILLVNALVPGNAVGVVVFNYSVVDKVSDFSHQIHFHKS